MDCGLFVEFPYREGMSEQEAFAECFALTEAAEAANVASVWLSEYHFSAISVLSSPITVASAIAARTQRSLQVGLDSQLLGKLSFGKVATVAAIAREFGEMLRVATPQQSGEPDAS